MINIEKLAITQMQKSINNYWKESNERPLCHLGGCSSGKIAETVLVAGLEEDDEYFERIRGIKNNFSRLVSLHEN